MTDSVETHPLIEQLIQQHIAFIEQQFLDTKQLQQEITALCQWLTRQSLKEIITLEQLHMALRDLFIDKEIPQSTLIQGSIYLRQALLHPINQNTTIAEIINPLHLDALAQYTASKSTQRKYLIEKITKHPAFATMASQLLQQVLNDYFQNHLSDKSSHVGRFMKIGKSVLENVTDLNLAQAIQQYLEKNVSKMGTLAEKMLNQHLNDEKVYQLHVQLWHELKNTPLSHIQHYIDPNDLPQTIPLLHQFWDHFRRSEFFEQQLQHALETWYTHHQNQSVLNLIQAIGTSEHQLNTQLHGPAEQIIKQFIADGGLKKHLQPQLKAFYYAPSTLSLLKQI